MINRYFFYLYIYPYSYNCSTGPATSLFLPWVSKKSKSSAGTGKTVVARMVGKLLVEMGVIKKAGFRTWIDREHTGHLIEISDPKWAKWLRRKQDCSYCIARMSLPQRYISWIFMDPKWYTSLNLLKLAYSFRCSKKETAKSFSSGRVPSGQSNISFEVGGETTSLLLKWRSVLNSEGPYHTGFRWANFSDLFPAGNGHPKMWWL